MAVGRVAGVGVLAIALLLLAVIAGRVPRTLGGSAVAAAIPAAPAAGQCLIARIESASFVADDQGLRQWGRDVRDCRSATGGADETIVVVGEVAGVLAARSGRPHDACAAPVAEFTGWPAPVTEGFWAIAGGPTVLVVNPDVRQWADGQRWQACVVAPPMWNEDGLFDPTRGLGPVLRESARGRWSDPVDRNRWGDCFDEYTGPAARVLSPVWCGTGHEIERLGLITEEIDPRSAALIRQTCAELVAARTSTIDPTHGGQLRIEADVTEPGTGPRELTNDDEQIPAAATADCLVRPADPTRLLTATIVGLGGGAVPLAPR